MHYKKFSCFTILTHKLGHILDVVITHSNSTLNSSITSVTMDHHPILSKVSILPTPPLPTTFTYRRIKSIDYSKFIIDLNASPLIKNPPNALTDLLDLYFSTLHSLLDCYASLLSKTNHSSCSSPSPWITPDILNLKSARHHLECIYINSRSISNWKMLHTTTNRYHKTILAAKHLF